MIDYIGMESPWHFSHNPIRIGAQIYGSIDSSKFRRCILSALVKKRNSKDKSIYALITLNDDFRKKREDGTFRVQLNKNFVLGEVVNERTIFNTPDSNKGFLCVRLQNLPLFNDLASALRRVSITRNVSENTSINQPARVRVLNGNLRLDKLSIPHARKNNHYRRIYRIESGLIAGEISNVKIVEGERIFEYDYCSLGQKNSLVPIVSDGEIGAPVISRTGCLFGFVVGIYSQMNLIYPAEQIAEAADVEFVTFGDDWPLIKYSKFR